MSDAGRSSFSLVRGGPFYRLLSATGLARGDRWDAARASAAAIALAWLPFLLLALIGSATAGEEPLLRSVAVHARLLVAVPCFFLAEASLHMRTARCIDRFVSESWAPGQDAAIARITAAIVRARDAWAPELLFLACAFAMSQSLLWGWTDPIGARNSGFGVVHSPDVFWYALVALPLFQFLALRWLWRWGLWAFLLYRLSRLRVRPVATHPDERGGLGFLAEPSVGFAWVVLGNSAVLAGAWATRIHSGSDRLGSFGPQALLLVATALLLAFGPVGFFAGCLWRARFAALRSYGVLANDYTLRFQRRWIDGEGASELLGTPDIQSLADLAGAYGVLRQMKIVPVTRNALLVVTAAALAPMALLILTMIPLAELVRELSGSWVGRLP